MAASRSAWEAIHQAVATAAGRVTSQPQTAEEASRKATRTVYSPYSGAGDAQRKEQIEKQTEGK